MEKIKIIDPNNSNNYFEIPWEWLKEGTQGPTLNDMEASAERSKLKAKLSRVRSGEVPAAVIDIDQRLSQRELYPLFSLLRLVAINIRYFEKYLNRYVTKKFYAQKPNPVIYRIPKDNNTDNIIYEKFSINFAGYEDINE